MSWAAVVGGAIVAGTSIYATVKANKEKKRAQEAMNRAMSARGQYQPSEASQTAMAEAAGHKNAISPAVLLAYQQAQAQAAGERNAVERNATSGAEALAAGSLIQGRFQNMIPGLIGAQEAYGDKRRSEYYDALQGMSRQEELAEADKQAKYSDLINFQLGRMGAANANSSQAMGTAAQGGGMIASGLNNYYNKR